MRKDNEVKLATEEVLASSQTIPVEIVVALKTHVEALKKEIRRLKTREFILVTALESIRTVSINRIDEVLIEFIELMLALEPDHEKN